MPLREVRPRRSHFCNRFVTHGEVVRFLVVLHPSRSEEWSSVIRVISEFALSSRLKVRVIASQLVVSVNLIEGVLVTEELVLREVHIISFGIEFISLFCREVLAITPGVIPMMVF